MREIKFRAWDNNKKEMTTTFDISSQGVVKFTPLGMSPKYLDSLIIIQYTGLKDKNGTEIYEGDVVKYKSPKLFDIEECEYLIQDVSYDSGAWDPVYLMDHQFHDTNDKPMKIEDVEIIGNLYANPELLKYEKRRYN